MAPRDDYESSGGESGDDYVQEKQKTVKKKVRRERQEEEVRRPKKRKRRLPAPTIEQDLDSLPPEQGRYMPIICCYSITMLRISMGGFGF